MVSSDEDEHTLRKKAATSSRSPEKPRNSAVKRKTRLRKDDEDFDMESLASEISDQNLVKDEEKPSKRKPLKKSDTKSKVEKGTPAASSSINGTTGKDFPKKFEYVFINF